MPHKTPFDLALGSRQARLIYNIAYRGALLQAQQTAIKMLQWQWEMCQDQTEAVYRHDGHPTKLQMIGLECESLAGRIEFHQGLARALAQSLDRLQHTLKLVEHLAQRI